MIVTIKVKRNAVSNKLYDGWYTKFKVKCLNLILYRENALKKEKKDLNQF